MYRQKLKIKMLKHPKKIALNVENNILSKSVSFKANTPIGFHYRIPNDLNLI